MSGRGRESLSLRHDFERPSKAIGQCHAHQTSHVIQSNLHYTPSLISKVSGVQFFPCNFVVTGHFSGHWADMARLRADKPCMLRAHLQLACVPDCSPAQRAVTPRGDEFLFWDCPKRNLSYSRDPQPPKAFKSAWGLKHRKGLPKCLLMCGKCLYTPLHAQQVWIWASWDVLPWKLG